MTPNRFSQATDFVTDPTGLLPVRKPVYLLNPPRRRLKSEQDPRRGIYHSFAYGPQGRTWLKVNTADGVLYLVNECPATNLTCEVVSKQDYHEAARQQAHALLVGKTLTRRQFPI